MFRLPISWWGKYFYLAVLSQCCVFRPRLSSTVSCRGLLCWAGVLNTELFHAGKSVESRCRAASTRKGSVQALCMLSTGRRLCSIDVSVGCFFSFCFEILSCWTHTWAAFQPWLWRQQAERRPLIFLPKEFFPLSVDVKSGWGSGIESLWAVQ